MESEDMKPNNLCRICINMMCQAYNVFEQFVESNGILDKLIKQHKLEEKPKHIGSCTETEELPQPSLEGCKLTTTKPALENCVKSTHDKETTSSDNIYETNCEEEFIMLVPDHQKVNTKMCDVFDSNEIESILNRDDKGSDEEYSIGSAGNTRNKLEII